MSHKNQRHTPLKQTATANDTVEFEVEAICNKRERGGRSEYLVKWKGYVRTTWEPIQHLDGVSDNLATACNPNDRDV
jgi:hypothetical protein